MTIRAVEKTLGHEGTIARVCGSADALPDRVAPPEPTCLAIWIDVVGLEYPVGVKFDAPEQVDALVAKLRRYRRAVWPWHTPEGGR